MSLNQRKSKNCCADKNMIKHRKTFIVSYSAIKKFSTNLKLYFKLINLNKNTVKTINYGFDLIK